jgi:hypothetical protein
MLKKLVLLTLLTFSKSIYSQEKKLEDYVITISNDTISGKFEKINVFKVKTLKLLTKDGVKKYNYKQLKEVRINGERYTRRKLLKTKEESDTYAGHFTKLLVENGEIKVIQISKFTFLIKGKTAFYRRQLKYYADDFSSTKEFLKQKDNSDSTVAFIKKYNAFRELNPLSQCFSERNIHFKKFFNPQLAVNFVGVLPSYGYVGMELGFNKFITISPRISYLIGRASKTDNTLNIYPYAEIIAKVYPLSKRRIMKGRRTFLNSGYNFSMTYMRSLQQSIIQAVRTEIGFKSVEWSKVYFDYNVGTLYAIKNSEFNFWGTVGIGYSF